jgi:hypothetical protein
MSNTPLPYEVHLAKQRLQKQQEKPITLLQFILYNVIGLCFALLVIMAYYYATFK